MDFMKKVTESIYAEAKEAVEGALLIGLILHYTGYTPNNIDKTDEDIIELNHFITSMCDDVVSKMNEDQIRELIKNKDDEMDVFKKELLNLMKKMETT